MEQQQTSGVSRRGFIKLVMTAGLGLAAQGALSPSIAWAQDTGLSREGVRARFLIGSDLHIQSGIGGTEGRDADLKLQFAFDTIYALDPQLDAFCLVGDITDNGRTEQYEHLMELIDDPEHNVGYNGGAGRTQMILCQGNHETYDPGVSAAPERFAAHTGQQANKVVDVNGVKVITMGPRGASDGDYRPNYDWFVEQLENEVGGSSEPFLVLTHHQMQGTSYTSPEWHGNFGQGGDTDFALLMGSYPNLIQVSGHSHATLEDERSISQDLGFTAIQDSTIGAYYENETGKVDPDSGDGASVPPQTSDAYTEGKSIQEASQCVIVDVMEDDTVRVYRVSLVRSRVEGEGTVYLYDPWVLDIPSMVRAQGNLSDTETWRYTSARESTAAPSFPEGAQVTVGEVTNTSATVSFPSARPGSDSGLDLVHEYKLVAEAEDGAQVVKRVFSDYYRPAAYIRDTWNVLVKGLAAQTTYTMSVFAQTSWNKEAGSEGSGTWTGATEPAPNSTSAPIVSAAFTTGSAPERPRAILDIDYRSGETVDAMGHTPNREQGMGLVEDEELGYQALEADGETGWGYLLDADDYEQFAGASTHECLFKLVDNQTDQCVFSNQQSAGAGFEVENGNLEFWYNGEGGRVILGTPVETDRWVHAVATYDGETVALYVDGELADSAAAGRLNVPSPKRYYVGSDVSSSNMPEICCAAGTRVALARLFPYAMTASQVSTAYAAAQLAPAPERLLDVDFSVAGSADAVADAAGHEAVRTDLAAGAALAVDETLGKTVFEGDGASAFGFRFTEDDYAYLGNEHALECVFLVADDQADQCFLSNQQVAGDGLEVAGNADTRGKMAFWFNSVDSGTPKPAGAVSTGVWHHAMGVYSCGTVRFYLDGKLQEELDARGGMVVPAEGARAFYVGADVTPDGGGDLFIREGAKIASARIWSKAPSSERVAELAAGFPVAPGSEEETFTVTYAWAGDAPSGVELPVDGTAYAAGDTVSLPASPVAGATVAGERDGVAGTWTFTGWDHEDGFAIEEDTVVTGAWSFEADDDGTGDGTGSGSGTGDGDGSGSGSGTGSGAGSADGDGSGSGTGAGDGDGSGTGTGEDKGSGSPLPQTGDLSGLLGGLSAALGAASLGAAGIISRLKAAASGTGEPIDEDEEL